MDETLHESSVQSLGHSVIASSLAATMIAAAIAFNPASSDAFATPKLAALMVGTAATVATASMFKLAILRVSCVWLVVAGAVLLGHWSSADLLGAPYHRHGLATFGSLITLGMVAATLPRDILRPVICWPLLCVAAIVGTYAWLQAFGLDGYSWSITAAPISTLGNPNSLGCIGLMVAFGAHYSGANVANKNLRRCVLLVGFSMAGLSGSRMALLLGMTYVGTTLARGRRWSLSLIACLGLAAGIFIPEVATTNGPREQSLREDSGPTFADSVRVEIWLVTARIVANHPYFGVGPADFSDVFSSNIGADSPALWQLSDYGRQDLIVNDPHSLPLEAVSFFGFVPTLVLLALLMVAAGRLRSVRSPAGQQSWLILLPPAAVGLVNPLGIAEMTLAAVALGALFSVPRIPIVVPGPAQVAPGTSAPTSGA